MSDVWGFNIYHAVTPCTVPRLYYFSLFFFIFELFLNYFWIIFELFLNYISLFFIVSHCFSFFFILFHCFSLFPHLYIVWYGTLLCWAKRSPWRPSSRCSNPKILKMFGPRGWMRWIFFFFRWFLVFFPPIFSLSWGFFSFLLFICLWVTPSCCLSYPNISVQSFGRQYESPCLCRGFYSFSP